MHSEFLRLLQPFSTDLPLTKKDFRIAGPKHIILIQNKQEIDYFFDQIMSADEPRQNLYNLLSLNRGTFSGPSQSSLFIFLGNLVTQTKDSTFGYEGNLGIIPLFIRDMLLKKNNLEKDSIIQISAIEENNGQFFDLLAKTGLPLQVDQKMAFIGRIWARIHDQLDATYLVKLIVFNNNSRDFKNSIFEYFRKDHNNILLTIRISNLRTKSQLFFHFAQFVTALDYVKKNIIDYEKLNNNLFIKLLRSLRPFKKVQHIYHLTMGKSELDKSIILLHLKLDMSGQPKQSPPPFNLSNYLSKIQLQNYRREDLTSSLQKLESLIQFLDNIQAVITKAAVNKMTFVFRLQLILTQDLLTFKKHLDIKSYRHIINVMPSYALENTIKDRQKKTQRIIARCLSKMKQQPKISGPLFDGSSKLTSTLNDISSKLAIYAKDLYYRTLYQQSNFMQVLIHKLKHVQCLKLMRRQLRQLSSQIEGSIYDDSHAHSSQRIDIKDVLSYMERHKPPAKINAIRKKKSRLNTNAKVIPLSSFLCGGNSILVNQNSQLVSHRSQASVNQLPMIRSTMGQKLMVEEREQYKYEEIYDTERVVSKRLIKKRLVLMKR